jgi:tyrosyl-DNA phosphodiesterase-1
MFLRTFYNLRNQVTPGILGFCVSFVSGETMDPSRKRPAPVDDCDEPTGNTPLSLTHPVSPPLKRRQLAVSPQEKKENGTPLSARVFKSPFHLTKIRDLPPEMNKDTITLKDILGDPLIAECWEFNYLHDLDFLMSAFDEDVRHLVKVHVVHGFWKREDPSRLKLQVGRPSILLPHAQANRAVLSYTVDAFPDRVLT